MINGHGDDAYTYSTAIVSDFSSNVYNRQNLSGLKAHLRHSMESIEHYPEPAPYLLEAQLAAYHHLQPTEVCVTSGATEAIYLIAQTFRGTHSAVVQPTFSEYADACRMHAHPLTSLYRLPDVHEHYRLPADVRMLWLCNPNNPTGGVIERSHLQALLQQNPEVLFVVDQSYEAFTLAPLLSASEGIRLSNLLLLHSLTKRYGIPGLRLGYVTGCTGLLQRLRSHRIPWSVNSLAIQGGLYLTNHPSEATFPLETYLQETERLRNRLLQLKVIDVWETQTHFMLCRLRFGNASALKEYLAHTHGILIRDASNFEGLDEHFFRITTQRPEENDRLVQAIEAFIAL